MIVFYAELAANLPETASTNFHASTTVTHYFIIFYRSAAAAAAATLVTLFDDLMCLLHYNQVL